MPQNNDTLNHIFNALQNAKKLEEKGQSREEICQILGLSPSLLTRWSRKYGGLDLKTALQLDSLREELCSIKKNLSQMELDLLVYQQLYLEKLFSPSKKREVALELAENHPQLSLNRICKILKISRSGIHYVPADRNEEEELRQKIQTLAEKNSRYGYRRIHALIGREGIHINHKKMYRIWQSLGLKVPQKAVKRSRVWKEDGSSMRLQPLYPNHIWSCDFISDRLSDGKKIRWFNVIDDYTRQCLASVPKGRFNGKDLQFIFQQLFAQFGKPGHIRNDNGPIFSTQRLQKFFELEKIIQVFISRGSPWENGYCESFNGKMRDEFLSCEIFDSFFEAEILTKGWVKSYNTLRPHSSLGGNSPMEASKGLF